MNPIPGQALDFITSQAGLGSIIAFLTWRLWLQGKELKIYKGGQ